MKKALIFFGILSFSFMVSNAEVKKQKFKDRGDSNKLFEVCCDVGFDWCGGSLCIPMCAADWQQLSDDIIWHRHVLAMLPCPSDE